MSVRTMFRRVALFAAAPLVMLAASLPADDVRARETDTTPTEADQRFRAKYGIWPPHITAGQRGVGREERARSVDAKQKETKVKKEKSDAKPERERQ